VTSVVDTDICVIGAGSGGLSVAAGAAQMGADTVLVESGKMGGDCLNYGCIPSKALLAAAKQAYAMTDGASLGVSPVVPEISFNKVHDHVRGVIAALEPNDSQKRFEGLGVNVIRAEAHFVGRQEIEAGGHRIKARRIVIATGSSPVVPAITGLNQVPFFTNETLFDNETCPDHLVIIGGGPIGVEMAQAHVRLGAKVTILEMFSLMAKDDPELVAVLKNQLIGEGVDIREGVKVNAVEQKGDGLSVSIEGDNTTDRVYGSHLLVATGRQANVAALNLEAAGIDYDRNGIKVDKRLRTTNKKVFAIGDVTGGLQFTHVANYHAGIVIRNALFRLPAKANHNAVPWVTYTDPELANVGLTEAQARARRGDRIRVLTWPLEENDRAQAERKTDGMIKVITNKTGRILGASIVAPHAGELIQPWVLAISAKLKIRSMAGYIAPFPSLGEISKRAASSYYTPALFSKRTRRMVRLLGKLG